MELKNKPYKRHTITGPLPYANGPVHIGHLAGVYIPADIIGIQVCLLANPEPREIKGIISQGMILMAEDKDGSLRFVAPLGSVWNGGTIN